MRYLTNLPNNNPKWKFWLWFRRYYYLERPFTYYSEKYNLHKTVPAGRYDGATGALDVCPCCWLVHDAICADPYWDDGTPITSKVAADVLSTLLDQNGYKFRSISWKYMTKWFGCKRAKGNDY